MMKIKNALLSMFIVLSISAFGQNKQDIIKSINQIEDQFKKNIKLDSGKDYIIIYVPGTNNPFEKIYDRLKGKKIKKDVVFIGGFKELITTLNCEKKIGHLREAFISRYGKSHFSIFMDCKSKIEENWNAKGYTIIQLFRNREKPEIKSFEFNRGQFLKELNEYLIS